MAPRLSGQNSNFSDVFFLSKSLLRIERQKQIQKQCNLVLKASVRILIYRTWPIGEGRGRKKEGNTSFIFVRRISVVIISSVLCKYLLDSLLAVFFILRQDHISFVVIFLPCINKCFTSSKEAYLYFAVRQNELRR